MPTKEDTLNSKQIETLRSIADMFPDKNDREELRVIVSEGATIKELANAYRTQKGVVSFLKASSGLIIVMGGAYAVLKGISFKS